VILMKVLITGSDGFIGKNLICRLAQIDEVECITFDIGDDFQVIKKQIDETIFKLSAEEFAKLVIAYEPIWAIGTGVTASTEQAQEMLAFIRTLIAEKFGAEIAENTSILYGGSCNAQNASELFAQPDIDGGLIGGASLKSADFKAIIDAF